MPENLALKIIPVRVQEGPESCTGSPFDVLSIVVDEQDAGGRLAERRADVAEQRCVALALVDMEGIEHGVEVAVQVCFLIDLVEPVRLVAQDGNEVPAVAHVIDPCEHEGTEHEPPDDLLPQVAVGSLDPGLVPDRGPEIPLACFTGQVAGLGDDPVCVGVEAVGVDAVLFRDLPEPLSEPLLSKYATKIYEDGIDCSLHRSHLPGASVDPSAQSIAHMVHTVQDEERHLFSMITVESGSERIPRSLLWHQQAIRISVLLQGIVDSLQLAAVNFNTRKAGPYRGHREGEQGRRKGKAERERSAGNSGDNDPNG